MLAEIAHDGFVNDQLFFDEQTIVKSISDFLGDSVDNPKYLDGKKILNAIAAQQGILVQRAEDVYSFSHLTLQEYLTALYINEDDSLVQQLISHHLTDKRWREVFLLVAGLKNDASKFLLSMEKATQKLIDTDKLHNLLVWVKYRTDNSPGDFQPVGKRAIALTNAFAYPNANAFAYPNTLTNAFAFANTNAYPNANIIVIAYAYANTKANNYAYSYAYAKALDKFIDYSKWSEKFQIYRDVNYYQLISSFTELKQQISDQEEAIEVHQAFGKKMIQIWLETFHLTPDMIDLSDSELKALDNYFYANLLMVECEKSAVRVSRKTWSEIESRMLMPFRDSDG